MFCKLEKFPRCILRSPIYSVVLLSGGQDSAVTLALAASCSDRTLAVSFDYGQRHRIELQCAERIASALGAEHLVLTVPALEQLGNSALVGSGGGLDVRDAHPGAAHLPASFVPGRNGLFLQLAAAAAYARGGYSLLWGGWCQTDYSGYPDCRFDFLEAQERALRLGLAWSDLTLCAPLLYESKASAFHLARRLGEPIEQLVLEQTMTCYRGDRSQRHPWGYGCGDCAACDLRGRGYQDYLAEASPLPDRLI